MSNNNQQTNEIKFTVKGKTGTFTFSAIAHKALCQKEFMLDPIQFYLALGKRIPSGEQWEIEIFEPNREFLKEHKLHHYSSSRCSNSFVCYPSALPTFKNAKSLFKVWCAGSVLTVERGIDPLVTYDGNEEKFLAQMAEEYGITLEECE